MKLTKIFKSNKKANKESAAAVTKSKRPSPQQILAAMEQSVSTSYSSSNHTDMSRSTDSVDYCRRRRDSQPMDGNPQTHHIISYHHELSPQEILSLLEGYSTVSGADGLRYLCSLKEGPVTEEDPELLCQCERR